MTEPRITLPDMCKMHQSLLVHQTKYKKTDPWQSVIIAAQIALFQAATADPKTHERTGGVVERLPELGCLACYKPDAFGEIVEAAKTHDLGSIKKLGDSWGVTPKVQLGPEETQSEETPSIVDGAARFKKVM